MLECIAVRGANIVGKQMKHVDSEVFADSQISGSLKTFPYNTAKKKKHDLSNKIFSQNT